MFAVLGTVSVIVGCVIGAGFASGHELFAFFKGNYLSAAAIAIFFFILFFAVSALFLFNGRRLKPKDLTELNAQICGRTAKIFDVLFLINYFLFLSAMLAAAQSLFVQFVGETKLPVYSLLTAIFCALALLKGVGGIESANLILLPAVVFFIIFVVLPLPAKQTAAGGGIGFAGQTVQYVGMNASIMCGVLTASGKKLTKKQIWWSAGISSAILSILIYIILRAFSAENFTGIEMPLLYLASRRGVAYTVYGLVILASVVTSAMSAALPLTEFGIRRLSGKKVSVAVVLGLAFCLSTFGFSLLSDWIAQVVSVVGICFVALNVFSLLTRRGTERTPRAPYILDRRKKLPTDFSQLNPS